MNSLQHSKYETNISLFLIVNIIYHKNNLKPKRYFPKHSYIILMSHTASFMYILL